MKNFVLTLPLLILTPTAGWVCLIGRRRPPLSSEMLSQIDKLFLLSTFKVLTENELSISKKFTEHSAGSLNFISS